MTAATSPRYPTTQAASPRQFNVAPNTKVMAGMVVGRYPSGTNKGFLAEIGTDPSLVVEGVARMTVDNTGNAGAGPDCLVADDFIIELFSTGLDPSMEGSLVYGVDNQTFSMSSGGGVNQPIGEFWEYVSATSARVRVGKLGVARATQQGGTGGQSVALADASPTIQIGAGRWRVMPASTLTANRTITLGVTGAKAGDVWNFTRLDANAFTLAFANGGANPGALVTMPASKINFADFEFDGSDWKLKRVGTQ